MRTINELNAFLKQQEPLTTKEYLGLLQEIKKNYLVKLTHMSMNGEVKGSVGILTIVERCHWLIDSVERQHKTELEITTTKRVLGWEYPEAKDEIADA